MRGTKRVFDLVASLTGLVVLAPLFAVIALLVLLVDGPPVFFKQERVGLRGKIFCILKFRTMALDSGQSSRLLTVGIDPRITFVGGWLRKFKLDELPQLVNVVKGVMSLVGPRPEVPQYVSRYTQEQRRVLDLVPGITDPASIVFRDEAGLLQRFNDPEQAYIDEIVPEKVRLNLTYAERASVLSDLKVILETLAVLCRKRW